MLLKEIKNVHEGDDELVIVKLEHSKDSKSFWNGVTWMGSKAQAHPIKKSEVPDLERKYRVRAKQFPVGKLAEESLEQKTAEDLWAENKDSAAEYIPSTTYLVRSIKDSNPTMYEVFRVVGTSSKPFGKFNAKELADTLKPIRPNQTPDAEGFTTYVDPGKVEAFKYSGDPVRVTVTKDTTVTMNKGDYLVRTVKGSSFEYSVEIASDFDGTMKKD
mgnify:CR=1 FL=1|jgi:hypothetical protein